MRRTVSDGEVSILSGVLGRSLSLSMGTVGPNNRLRIRAREDEEEETRKKTGNEMEPPNAYLGIACLLVAPLVLPVSFFLLPPIARAGKETERESRKGT